MLEKKVRPKKYIWHRYEFLNMKYSYNKFVK